MIICAFDAQARILANTLSYEVDMSFKRVKDKDMKEVVFAKHYQEIGKGKSKCLVDVY